MLYKIDHWSEFTSHLKTFFNLLDLFFRQFLAKLDWPDGNDMLARLADVRPPLREVGMVKNGLTVDPDDRHCRRHRYVARKLRLTGDRNVTWR